MMQAKNFLTSDLPGAIATPSPLPNQAAIPISFSRRAFFQRIAVLGSATLLAPVLLTACGGNEEPAATADATTDTNTGAPTTCVTEGMGDPGIRKALVYVDESPNADKNCANCKFFKAVASGETCGGCEIITGPIAPTGYCNSWVTRSA